MADRLRQLGIGLSASRILHTTDLEVAGRDTVTDRETSTPRGRWTVHP